jgi:hypothetical protein
MAYDEMDKFFGLDNPSGQRAVRKERARLDALIKARLAEAESVSWDDLKAELLPPD